MVMAQIKGSTARLIPTSTGDPLQIFHCSSTKFVLCNRASVFRNADPSLHPPSQPSLVSGSDDREGIVGSENLESDEAQSPVFDQGIVLIYQSSTASTPVPEMGAQSQNHIQGSPVPRPSLRLSVPLIMLRLRYNPKTTPGRVPRTAKSGAVTSRRWSAARNSDSLIRGS